MSVTIRKALSALIGFAVIVVLWQLISAVASSTVPKPAAVLGALAYSPGRYLKLATTTGSAAAAGLLLATLIGLVVSSALVAIPRLGNAMTPFLVCVKAIPVITFVPLLMYLLGSGPACKVATAAIISLFPIIIGALDGARQVPERHKMISFAYGAGRVQEFAAFLFAYGGLGLAHGLKTAAPLAVVGSIVGEYLAGGTPAGLGHYIMGNMNHFDLTSVYVGGVVSAFLGLAFFGVAVFVHATLEARLKLAHD